MIRSSVASLLILVCFTCSCRILPFKLRRMSKHHAIKLAEHFVRNNGYTNEPIDTSKHKLSFELNDQILIYSSAGDHVLETILKKRYNSLSPKASFIYHDKKEKDWVVGFISCGMQTKCMDTTHNQSEIVGRAIIVNEDFRYSKMMHLRPDFSVFKKIKH